MKEGASKGSGVVGICSVGGRAPPIEYKTVEWLQPVLRPHIPKKGGLLALFWIPPACSANCWGRKEKVAFSATLNKG